MLEESLMRIPTRSKPPRPDPVNGDQLLHDISQFIGRYLQCTEHQRTVMALWILHTYCLTASPTTPYLSIQSVEKQAGKSLCLRLLGLLCSSPALTAGFTASSFSKRIDESIPTVLLDDCQATLGTSARSKGPVLRAILASGYCLGPGYTDSTHERNTFAAKAFAGRGGLPEELADRSIPIILEPLMDYGAQEPVLEANAEAPSPADPKIERFHLPRAVEEARPLQDQLNTFSEQIMDELAARPAYANDDFHDGLSPRRRDLIAPLFHLADFIGYQWPARIRAAVVTLFQEESTFDLLRSVQLLADIRDCFAQHNYPKGLSTSALLAWLQSLPPRPWDIDGSINARTLARLLNSFDISPRVQRIGPLGPARGYQLQDFIEPWQIFLAFNLPAGEVQETSVVGSSN